MSAVRGKFKVTNIIRTHLAPKSASFRLEAEYSRTPEDNSYALATPAGTIELHVSNPEAAAKLELGKSFYVDFTPVEEKFSALQ